MVNFGRTDLASEAHRLANRGTGDGALEGVSACREQINGLSVMGVEVLNQKGAEAIGKPEGKYYTLELDGRFERGAEEFSAAAEAIAELIGRCAKLKACPRVFIAAL